MKKDGATLLEILVTLTIIGIVTAFVLPAVNTMKPDETKIAFLKNYDAVTEAIQDLMNSRYFPATQDFGSGGIKSFSKYPLCNTAGDGHDASNTNKIKLNDGTIIDNTTNGNFNTKLCELLAHSFNVSSSSHSCNSTMDSINDRPLNFSFTTPTGESYYVATERDSTSYITYLAIDVNGSVGNNCVSRNPAGGAPGCSNPDTFLFAVYADGSIIPMDNTSEHYINTRTNTKSHKLSNEEKGLKVTTGAWNNDTDIKSKMEIKFDD